MSAPKVAPERVLPTMNLDGSRRLLRPVLTPGRFWHARRAVAYALMVVFFLLPYLRMNGKPMVLLDLPRREFTFFGYTFLPTDTLLFMLLFVSAGITIFLLTALLGRVWCGWACPQTVYMEFLFRPLERLLEGGPSGTVALDREQGFKPRRVAKYAVYAVLALFLAHTFLAYFVGIERLVQWVQQSPFEHPTAFFIMAGTTVAIYFNFTWFREQTCLVACPYGRLQSVLLDRKSLIVAYQPLRGEPRDKGRERTEASGDCIDCGACVRTCPTGIDIRDGLQMECIHCTQCMDACDEIMDKVGKPRGLIKYSNRCEVEGRPSGLLRPRVVLYPAALLTALGVFGYLLSTKQDTDITLLRGIGAPYAFDVDGRVVNNIRIKLTNRGGEERRYRIELLEAEGIRLVAPENPLPVAAGSVRTEGVFIMASAGAFEDGQRPVRFRISDGGKFTAEYDYLLVGPREGEHPRGDREQREHEGPR
jgi:cytochrome c oxidase accessory protein FixG